MLCFLQNVWICNHFAEMNKREKKDLLTAKISFVCDEFFKFDF